MIERTQETNNVVGDHENRTVNTGHIGEADFKEGCIYVLDAVTRQEWSWKRIPGLLYFLSPSSSHCLPPAEQGTELMPGEKNQCILYS